MTTLIGRRPAGDREQWSRWLKSLPRRLVFALPLLDIHSPCRLHRLEKLAAIPLQSASSFLDTEVLAKATFLGHLIDEVDVPPLRSLLRTAGRWSDWKQVFRHPLFKRVSGPAEEAQGQHECRRLSRRRGSAGPELTSIKLGPSRMTMPERSDQLREGQEHGSEAGRHRENGRTRRRRRTTATWAA